MKTKLIGLLMTIVLCYFSINISAEAQVQRLGLMKGSYFILSFGYQRVDSYCLDKERDIPNAQTDYKYVLSDTNLCTVVIGGEKMTLRTAINRGYVEITGTTIKDVINDEHYITNLPEQEGELYNLTLTLMNDPKLTYSKLVNYLKNPIVYERMSVEQYMLLQINFIQPYEELSTFEKDTMDSISEMVLPKFFDEFLSIGDFSNIKFLNKTDKNMTIAINELMILGNNEESIDDINVIYTKYKDFNNDNSLQKFDIQQDIWSLHK
jgi:hypothetical protein